MSSPDTPAPVAAVQEGFGRHTPLAVLYTRDARGFPAMPQNLRPRKERARASAGQGPPVGLDEALQPGACSKRKARAKQTRPDFARPKQAASAQSRVWRPQPSGSNQGVRGSKYKYEPYRSRSTAPGVMEARGKGRGHNANEKGGGAPTQNHRLRLGEKGRQS